MMTIMGEVGMNETPHRSHRVRIISVRMTPTFLSKELSGTR
ncbi:hypothetical protein PJI16_17950 [Nitrospira sp. MA-1]|nr:hypothetical protein [Nitrospira sp. MA-1]